MRLMVVLLTAAACFGQSKQNVVQTGFVDAHGANWIPPTSTFASPPASPATGSVYVFTDASAVGTCAGTGSSLATCRWSGSAWSAVGGGGGGSAVTVVKACSIAFSNSAFIANATGVDVNCGSAIAANTKVVGITLKHSAAFAGTGITSMTASVGVSGSPAAYSGLTLDVFQAAGTAGGKYLDSGGWGSYSMASHQPVVHFNANTAVGNGSATVLTAGSVDVWIATVALP